MWVSAGRPFRGEGMHVQRPRGRTGPGVLEEQQGGPCGWRRVSQKRGERGNESREKKWGRALWAKGGRGWGLGLFLKDGAGF